MYPTNALLHGIILAPIFVALAAPAISSPYDTEDVVIRQSEDSFNEAYSLEKRQEEPSKIGASVYRGADYNDYLGTVDDLTQTLGKSFNPQNDATASSFQLLHRGLQGQEQLDISTGETCDVFIYSYLPGTLPDCYNWATFRCMRLWDNPGL